MDKKMAFECYLKEISFYELVQVLASLQKKDQKKLSELIIKPLVKYVSENDLYHKFNSFEDYHSHESSKRRMEYLIQEVKKLYSFAFDMVTTHNNKHHFDKIMEWVENEENRYKKKEITNE